MELKEWQSRLMAAVAIFFIQSAHQYGANDAANTPLGMLIYHGSAMMADFCIIVVASEILRSRISLDIQCLNMAAMAVNALGWIFYLAYLPPLLYDAMIMALGYAQWIRLLWMDDDAVNTLRAGLVRRDATGSPKLHHGKAH